MVSLYNIGAVVAFHPASLKRLQSLPGLITVNQRIGPVHLMKINQTLNWFVQGEGKVKAGLNRIEVLDVKGDELVLKFHWTEGLASTPHVDMEPVIIGDDPIPFIKVRNPPSSFVLKIHPR